MIFVANTLASAYLYVTLDALGGGEILLQMNLLFGLAYLPWQVIHLRLLDEVPVKGRKQAVLVHEVLGADDDAQLESKRATREQFEQAVQLYRSEEFVEAQKIFSRIVLENPDDKAAELLLSRCEHYSRHGAPLGWV